MVSLSSLPRSVVLPSSGLDANNLVIDDVKAEKVQHFEKSDEKKCPGRLHIINQRCFSHSVKD